MVEMSDLITERQSSHGEFTENAKMTWDMMRVLMRSSGWDRMNDGQRHSAYMVVHKLSRAVSGDADFRDHWDDIGGYSKLVADRIVSPVAAPERDMYDALAVGWGCTREEAKKRVYQLSVDRRRERESRSVHVSNNVVIQSSEETIETVALIGRTRVEGQEASTGQGVTGILLGTGSISRDAYVRDNHGAIRRLSHYDVIEVMDGPGTPEDGGHHAKEEDPE